VNVPTNSHEGNRPPLGSEYAATTPPDPEEPDPDDPDPEEPEPPEPDPDGPAGGSTRVYWSPYKVIDCP